MTAQASTSIDIWLTTGASTSVAMTAAPTSAKPSVVACQTTGIVDGDLVIPELPRWAVSITCLMWLMTPMALS